jgi:DNA-binding XRE family transcriptional regulator
MDEKGGPKYIFLAPIDKGIVRRAGKYGFPFRHARYPAAIRSRPLTHEVRDARRLNNGLRIIRSWRHMKQSDLARSAGISKTALSNIECGKSVPSIGTALVLAEILQVSVRELFTLSGQPKKV